MQAKSLLLSTVLLSLLALPVVGQLSGLDSGLRTLDMRAPVPTPGLPRTVEEWRSLPQRLDRYLSDSFGFRPRLITAHNALRHALGAARSPDVLVGKDDWLFFTGEREHDQYLGLDRFTDASLDRWLAAMEERRAWLAARGIQLVVLIPPNKHSIYPEMLPDWVGRRGPTTRLDQLMARVGAGSPLQVIDLRSDLQAAKSAAPVFFKRDSHWTAAGAFAAYRRLADWILARRPDFRPLQAADLVALDAMRPRPGADLDLARLLGLRGSLSEPDRMLAKRDPSRIRSRENLRQNGAAVEVITSDVAAGPSLLLFRDSFALAMIPFLAESVPRLVIAEHQRSGFDPTLVETHRPDIVIYEIVERLLYVEPVNPPGLASR